MTKKYTYPNKSQVNTQFDVEILNTVKKFAQKELGRSSTSSAIRKLVIDGLTLNGYKPKKGA